MTATARVRYTISIKFRRKETNMDWLAIIELVIATIALGYAIYRTIITVKEGKLLPVIMTAIEEAEMQSGLTGEEKLQYALDYINREATTKGVSVNLNKTVKLIETIVSLTKKVNFK